MSFQDVGKNNTHRRAASASMQPKPSSQSSTTTTSTIPETSSWTSGIASLTSAVTLSSSLSSSSTTTTATVGQISESLTQYQRNVGILEKIAQSLQQQSSAPSSSSSSSHQNNNATRVELEQQYKAQLDVLRQLEQRVRTQLQTSKKQSNGGGSQQHTAIVKLERDFERVQTTAQACRAKVTKLQKQQQQRSAAAVAANQQSAASNAFQDEQHKFQLQLQEDRLQEEIMREREAEIRNINRGMHQVNEIYKDLAHIVGSQQEQVNQIETQMEESKNNAESGLEQVQKANDKYGQSQCIIS